MSDGFSENQATAFSLTEISLHFWVRNGVNNTKGTIHIYMFMPWGFSDTFSHSFDVDVYVWEGDVLEVFEVQPREVEDIRHEIWLKTNRTTKMIYGYQSQLELTTTSYLCTSIQFSNTNNEWKEL